MKTIRWGGIALIATIALLASTSPAVAQGTGSGDYEFAFYLWGSHLDGSVGIGPVDASADASFSDLLENLEFAIAHGSDAAVLAPLSIRGIADPVRFLARDVSDLLDALPRRIPVYLYDNADIAIDPRIAQYRIESAPQLSLRHVDLRRPFLGGSGHKTTTIRGRIRGAGCST